MLLLLLMLLFVLQMPAEINNQTGFHFIIIYWEDTPSPRFPDLPSSRPLFPVVLLYLSLPVIGLLDILVVNLNLSVLLKFEFERPGEVSECRAVVLSRLT